MTFPLLHLQILSKSPSMHIIRPFFSLRFSMHLVLLYFFTFHFPFMLPQNFFSFTLSTFSFTFLEFSTSTPPRFHSPRVESIFPISNIFTRYVNSYLSWKSLISAWSSSSRTFWWIRPTWIKYVSIRSFIKLRIFWLVFSKVKNCFKLRFHKFRNTSIHTTSNGRHLQLLQN